MPSVTIDAGVLAAPPEESSVDAVHGYVDTLLDWHQLLDERWVAIYMSTRASEALFADGLYPLRDNLKNLFAANRIKRADSNTVATVVNTLLQRTPSFETYFGVRDVLTEKPSTDPDTSGLAVGNTLQSDLDRCLILIAILRKYCGDPIRDHFLILRYAPEPVVTVQAKIQVIEHDRDDLNELPTCPEMFQGDVLICDDFRGLVKCLDASSILVNSTDNVGLETAIRVALYKSRIGRGEDPDWDDLRGLSIGHSFFDGVKMSCRNQASSFRDKVLRAIVETLDGKNMEAVHEIRTSSGGGSRQLKRRADGAGAMRRDIDPDHHLHYWSCGNGVVELASVNYPHNNLSIPE